MSKDSLDIGTWLKCPRCGQIIFLEDIVFIEEDFENCPVCDADLIYRQGKWEEAE